MTKERLVEWFSDKRGVVVAFSGGVDSAVVAKAAQIALGDRATAATSSSPTLPARELEGARRLAKEIGIRHVVLEEDEFSDPRFRENGPERCYHCRKGLVRVLQRLASERGAACIVDGSNADDAMAHRPGLRAMREAGVRSPLMELGMGKEKVRAAARGFALSVAEKPSMACLASRVPYGEEITPEKLLRVERAEELIRAIGFDQVRVRSHDGIARVEVPKDDIPRLVEHRTEVATGLRRIGFSYVTLDLEGYRSGSMDEALGPGTDNYLW